MLKIDPMTCTGCRACEQACSVNCITFEKDAAGFIYPAVDTVKCVDCGQCEQVCHAKKQEKDVLSGYTKKREGFYGWCRESSVVQNSSSGGAFSAIVSAWLEDAGFVYGAAFRDTYDYVTHGKYTKHSYVPLRKSKYVFCDTADSYSDVKKMLAEGKKVIYSGTPCQIGGLKAFLKKPYANLLTVDFICHGTPSMDFLNAHLNFIRKGRAVTYIDFRSKALGWRKHCLKVCLDGNAEYLKPVEEDYYLSMFLGNKTLRSCCYACQYADGQHVSDITIADFWGIHQLDPDMHNDQGISLIIFNHAIEDELLSGLKITMQLTALDPQAYAYVFKSHASYDFQARMKEIRKIQKNGFQRQSEKFYRSRRLRKIKNYLGMIKRKCTKG
ncbi:MAG: Coenzyme F420 hydrogenase/dehydrogenase, beta subunit C-terminal domain [Oscillospiraceae bacterium]